MSMMASQISGVLIVCSTVCSGADQRKHQISTSLAFLSGIQQWLVDSPHKGPLAWKMFPFDDVIWDVFCGLIPWFIFCLSRCSDISWYIGQCCICILWHVLHGEGTKILFLMTCCSMQPKPLLKSILNDTPCESISHHREIAEIEMGIWCMHVFYQYCNFIQQVAYIIFINITVSYNILMEM